MSAFSYLMGLYGENYLRLQRLVGDSRGLSGEYFSAIENHPTLWLTALEQHRHTSILRLTHRYPGVNGVELEPSAWIRVYHDTEQAEVTHCLISSRLKQLFSLDLPATLVGKRRQRMNAFFNKWLEHLWHIGHRPSGFATAINTSEAILPKEIPLDV